MADFPIYRLVKGSTLTFTEMDDNLRWLSTNMSGSTVTITGSVIGMSGSVNIIGDVQITGTASIGFIKSEGYSTGSNQLGDDTSDIQTLIGIVSVSGSMRVSGSTVINNLTGSLFGTSSWARNATTASYALNAVTASFASTASYVNPLNQQVIITGSLIQGLGNIATGEKSHAEGDSTQAIGNFSHAEGLGTIAYGGHSHAEGQDTIASGSYSHAEGNQTIALANHQHVQGQYNITSSAPAAFIIGNGTDDGNRSNLIHAAENEVQITGSLKVLGSITGSLFGTASNAVSSSYALSASYAVSSSYAYTASSAISAYTASSAVSSSYAYTASSAISAYTASSSVSSSYAYTASSSVSSSYAYTASSAISAYTASSSVSSSYAYTASSAISAYTASSSVSSSYAYTASSAISAYTASSSVSSSYAYTASSAISAYTASSSVSSSYAYTASSAISAYTASSSVSSSYAITASHAESLKIGLNLSASSINITNNIVANSITAQSASFGYVQTITGSAVIIGQEFIILNTQTPTARYAGLIIYDSGSSTTTASLVWDSQTNHFVYSNGSGSSYSGGGFIAGPRNSGSLADVTYPTLNRVVRGQGDDHIYDSNIIDNDIKVSISIPLAVTGSITATQGFTGSLFGTASSAVSSSYAYTASSSVSSSYAYTASSAISAYTALSSVSSSYAYTASSAISAYTASSSVSSSYAYTASSAVSSSYAYTASSAISAYTASSSVSSSYAYTASSAISASWSPQQLNGSGYVSMSGTTTNYVSTIPNSGLTNSSITIQGSLTSLGGSVNVINGTGFVKASGTSITYDNSTYYLASNPNGYTTNTGTVTSITVSPGTGMSGGGTITTSGTVTLTNTAPDQIVALTQGGTTVITGTYPNFTITSNDQYTGTVTGTGTANYLSKFTGTSAIGNSIVYDNGTNVGIGTTSPGNLLSVAGNISLASAGFLGFTGATTLTTSNYALYGSSINTYVNVATGGSVGLNIGNNSILTITGSNVGIGTTSPATLLHLYQNTAGIQNQLTLENFNTTAGADGSSIYFKGYQGSLAKISAFGYPQDEVGGYLQLQSYNDNTTANTGLIINNVGNVGIGTTSPNSILEISQATPIFRIQASANDQFHGIEFRQAAGFDASIKQLPVSGEFRIANGRDATWGGFITLYTDTSERIRVTATGNVGINTSAPGYKLSIQGNAGIEASEEYFYFNSAYTVGNNSRGKIRAVGAGGGSGYGGDLRFSTRNPSNVWNEDAMTINSSGNVGIGTTYPSAKLDVSGSILANNFNSDNAVVNTADTYTSTAKITNIITLSQAEYNAIGSPSSNYLYVII